MSTCVFFASRARDLADRAVHGHQCKTKTEHHQRNDEQLDQHRSVKSAIGLSRRLRRHLNPQQTCAQA
jgi:hypothetical protein